MQKTNALKCFVSAQFGTNTTILRDELSARGVAWMDTTNLALGSTILDGIINAIETSDFVCVVLPNSSDGASTLIELGIAIGMRKPLLLIAGADSSMRFDLTRYQVAFTSVEDREAIRFQLDNFIGSIQTKRKYLATKPGKALMPKSQSLSKRSISSHAESEIARLFENAGYLLHEVPSDGQYTVDIAVWIDELTPVFSSPILLVEIKRRVGPILDIELVDKLRQLVNARSAAAGLIVHIDGPLDLFHLDNRAPPFVFLMSMDDLRLGLQEGILVQKMIALRNRAVHGT